MDARVGVIVLLVVGVTVVGGGPAVAADSGQPEPLVSHPETFDTDETRMNIAIEPDGSAKWTIELWVQLDDTETTEAFESLEEDIDEDPTAHTQEFEDRIETTVDGASNATGREMSANDFHVETDRQSFAREYGILSYSFRWDGFAAVDGERLHIGDAIEGINANDGTRLLIEWPAEHDLESVSPDPDEKRERAVIWHGNETEFISGEPNLVLSSRDDGLSSTIGAASAGVVGIAGIVAIGVGWWYRTRRGGSGQVTNGGPPTDTIETTGDAPSSDSDPSTPPPSLMSNEEQVLTLLEESGERMRQQEIVEALDWTDAKTSKVVSGLREDGKLESFRLGRENVLSLPEAAEAESTD